MGTIKTKDSKNTPPIYKQLTDQLIHDVKREILISCDRLPPQRKLANFLDITLPSITHVYRHSE